MRSAACTTATATPLRDQLSVSVSAGLPPSPAGSATVFGTGDEPIVMSTSRPVATAIRSAVVRTSSWLRSSMPVTPATRTLIALIGSSSYPIAGMSASDAMLTSASGGVAR